MISMTTPVAAAAEAPPAAAETATAAAETAPAGPAAEASAPAAEAAAAEARPAMARSTRGYGRFSVSASLPDVGGYETASASSYFVPEVGPEVTVTVDRVNRARATVSRSRSHTRIRTSTSCATSTPSRGESTNTVAQYWDDAFTVSIEFTQLGMGDS